MPWSQTKARTGVKKYVSYWIARGIPEHMLNARSASFGQIIHRTVNETDEIRWLSIDDALNLLTRADDKNILLDFSRRVSAHQQHSCTLIIARRKTPYRRKWGGSSPSRPLLLWELLRHYSSCHRVKLLYASRNIYRYYGCMPAHSRAVA